MNRNLVVACLALLLVALTDPAWANDSVVFDSGYLVYPLNTDKVRMVEEHIVARMGVSIDESFTGRGAAVSCEFVFENTSEEEVSARVGFPTETYSSETAHSLAFEEFHSWVNGAPVEVEFRREVVEQWDDPYTRSDGVTIPYVVERFRFWYVWDVTFPPRGVVRIRNEYKTRLSGDTMDDHWFEYILTTGANWKGPIGRSLVEVIYDNPADLFLWFESARPAGYRKEADRLVWDFREFVPTENVRVNEVQGDPYHKLFKDYFADRVYDGDARAYGRSDLEQAPFEIFMYLKNNVQLVDQASTDALIRFLKRTYAQLLRNEIFARHGRLFKSYALLSFFRDMGWYRSKNDYSDDLLNDIERANVQFILDYERGMGWM